jgi:diacylglycerol kinase family enzyme
LLSDDLKLVLLRNASRAHLLRYTVQALTGIAPYDGLEEPNADLSFVSAKSVLCHTPEERGAFLRVQADGELLGPTPTEISIVPRGLTLLMPPELAPGADSHSLPMADLF